MNSFSQKVVGVVLSDKNEPIPFANIGMKGKNFGTVSDLNGKFHLEIPDSLNNKLLTFSSIGYQTKSFSIEECIQIEKFILPTDAVNLEEVNVVIRKRDLKTAILGNTTNSKHITANFRENQLGNELGTLIKIKRTPTYIEDFTINIANNQHKEVSFRLNIYDVKEDHPDKKILMKNVILTTSIASGSVTVDLKEYNIVTENDFVIAIEWIEDLPKDKLFFCAGMLGSAIFIREASQGDWEKVKGINLGMYVTVKH